MSAFLPTSAGLSEASVQVERCTGAPPQGKSISLAITIDFCIYLYACFQIGPKRPCSGHLCTKAFAGRQIHAETLMELDDMWPRDRAQLSVQQLVTQPCAAPVSYQVMPTGCDSAQGVQARSRAPGSKRKRVLFRSHPHRSHLVPGFHPQVRKPGGRGVKGSPKHEDCPIMPPVWILDPSSQFSLRQRQWVPVRRKAGGSSLQPLQVSLGQGQGMFLSLAPSKHT